VDTKVVLFLIVQAISISLLGIRMFELEHDLQKAMAAIVTLERKHGY
jgi:hypothetical protein